MKTKKVFSALLFLTVHFSYGQWTTDSISDGTIRMGGAKLGNKAYFAGGSVLINSNWVYTNKVEIYDMTTGSWQMEYLTEAREYATGVTCGDKVFFAGGLVDWPNASFTVDIYNALGNYETGYLSVPRFGLAALSYGDSLVFFAGGIDLSVNEAYDVVDIYHVKTHAWSTEHLSIPRHSMGYAVFGDRAFFAGGWNGDGTQSFDRVDIYNFTSRTWDSARLSQARGFIGATIAQNKILFAGGALSNGVPTDRVDIYDTETDTWTTASLSLARGFSNHQAVTVCGKAYFVGNGVFNNGWDTDTDTIDVYDPSIDLWSVMTMPHRLNDHTVVTMDSSMLIAGGWTFISYPYGDPTKKVEIFKDSICQAGVNVGNIEDKNKEDLFSVYPNPSSGRLNFDISNEIRSKSVLVMICNMQGQQLYQQSLPPGNHELKLDVLSGVYFLKVVSDDIAHTGLIIIQK